MLTRVYINNFRCFVNFEFHPEARQLILGGNGTGKSALFEALDLLRQLALEGGATDSLFPLSTRTRWVNLPEQEFSLEAKTTEGTYRYDLILEPAENPTRIKVKLERLTFETKVLLTFQEGEVHLHNDRYERTTTYPFDWYRSALAAMMPRADNMKLTIFKDWLSRLRCFRINPWKMVAQAETEIDYPRSDFSNFAAWYRHAVQEEGKETFELQRKLREILDGFDSLNLVSAGQNIRWLQAKFNSQHEHSLDFAELSEGQRALIALYAIVQFLMRKEATICIDEPESFVSLPEIQPWLFTALDRTEDNRGQLLLISHHPELMNILTVNHGVTFRRDGSGPVRVEKYEPTNQGGLLPSEYIARGWDRE